VEDRKEGQEIVYRPKESIKECKTGEKGQKGDREKRVKKGGEMGRRKTYPMSAFHVNNFEKVQYNYMY
jgi:hypothetical protein